MSSSLPPNPSDFDSTGLGDLANFVRKGILKQSRIALAVVGVLTLGFATYKYVQLQGEIDEAGPLLREAFASEIAEANLIFYLTMAVGVLFLGLAAFVYRYPLFCTLSGLVIYVAAILISGIVDPSTLYQGIIMRVAIVAVLINGVKTAIVYSKELKKEKAKHDALATAKVVSE